MNKKLLVLAVAVVIPASVFVGMNLSSPNPLKGVSFALSSSVSSSIPVSSSTSFVSSSSSSMGYCCTGDYCYQSVGCTQTLPQCLSACGSFSSVSSSFSSASSVSTSAPAIVDLSATLESNLTRVAANGLIVFIVKVKNVGTVATNGVFHLLRSDFTFVSATGGTCSVPLNDSTYIACSSNTIPANGVGTVALTLRAASNFTCANSRNYGRSTFAFVRSSDLFSQNDTTNIVNTLPACP